MWCPKCKTEYQDGITICTECGTKLVEGTEDEINIIELCEVEDRETADKISEYLQYSDITGVEIINDNDIFIITVPTDYKKQAEKLLKGFFLANEEAGQGDDETLSDDLQKTEKALENKSDASSKNKLNKPSKSYVKRADAYKDMKFSGITFLIFGILGILYLILCKINVIPLSYNIFVFIGILLMFTIFIIIGVTSFVKAGRIKLQIPEEEALTSEIMKWLNKNISKDVIDSWKDNSVSNAENDLIVIKNIQSELIKTYPDIDVSYLEMIADDYYNSQLPTN